jgi:hypothetical protein
MSRTALRKSITAAATLASLLALPAAGRAGYIFSRGALGANDSINWGTLGPAGTVVTQYDPALSPAGSYDPFTILSAGGLGTTVRINNSAAYYAGGYASPATIGTLAGYPSLDVSGTANDLSTNVVRINLTFAQPVVGFGADLHYDEVGTAPGQVIVQLYGVNHTDLGITGFSTAVPDPWTGFIGYRNDAGTPVISEVQIYLALKNPAVAPTSDVSIDQVDLVTGFGVAPTPEPSSLVLLGLGGVAAAGYRLLRRARQDPRVGAPCVSNARPDCEVFGGPSA